MSLLPTIFGSAVPETENVRIILVRANIFCRFSSAERKQVVEPITLNNLALVRENPFDFLQNLHLCDTTDSAETELQYVVNNYLEPSESMVIVESETPKEHRPNLLDLAKRLDSKVTFASSGQSNLSEHAVYGIFHLQRLDESEVRKLKDSFSTMKETALPMLIALHPDFSKISELAALLSSLDEKECERVMISGAFCRDNVANVLLQTTKVTLVVEPRGPSIEYIHSNQSSDPVRGDEDVAREVAKLMINTKTRSRLVLGLDFNFAIQLRRYGGPGFAVLFQFLERFRRLGLPKEAIHELCKSNAAKLLYHKQPAPQLPPSIKTFWQCAECGKQVEEGKDYFESHGQQFCSSGCMRKFRMKQPKTSENPSEGGGGRRFNHEPDGNWGLKT